MRGRVGGWVGREEIDSLGLRILTGQRDVDGG